MKFIYHPNAGEKELLLDGKAFKHVFISRRTKNNDSLYLQNLKDNKRYLYKVQELKKNKAVLFLTNTEKLPEQTLPNKKVALSIIDPKELKEAVRAMAQTGQSEFIFFYSERSQKNYKINTEKIKEIIIHSFEISGLNKYPKITTYKSIEELLENESGNIFMLDVGGKHIDTIKNEIDILLVGPEGGFTDNEKNVMKDKIASLSHTLTLTAKVAAEASLAKLIL